MREHAIVNVMVHQWWLLVFVVAGCGRAGFERSPVPTDFDPGCVLHLQMDELAWLTGADVIDRCGGHAARLIGTPTTADGGARGRVGTFGPDNCIEVFDAPDLRATRAVTVSAWAYPTQFSVSVAQGVVSKRTGIDIQTAYALFVFDGRTVWADIDGFEERVMGTRPLVSQQWQQLTLVYDGTADAAARTRIYVDGVLDAVATEASSSIPPFTSSLFVGCQPLSGMPAEFWSGQLDDIVIWDRALDHDEVGRWYDATRPDS